MNLFAQATGTPNSGASRAEDFQPLTRNPQPTQGALQPGTGPQSTSGQDILNNESARIVVPVSEGEASVPQSSTQGSGGVNWFLVIVVAAVIVVALEYFFRRRDRVKAPGFVAPPPQEVVMLPADQAVEDSVAEAEPASAEKDEERTKKPQVKKASTKKSPQKKKTKSKSKRKRSRK